MSTVVVIMRDEKPVGAISKGSSSLSNEEIVVLWLSSVGMMDSLPENYSYHEVQEVPLAIGVMSLLPYETIGNVRTRAKAIKEKQCSSRSHSLSRRD